MKTTTHLKKLIVFAIMISTAFVYAQEIKMDIENNIVNVSGDENERAFIGTTTFDGISAGMAGVYSSYFGAYAGRNSTGSTNTFIGGLSGSANVSNSQSTFVGFSAGRAFIGSGLNNAFFGLNTGWSQVSGGSNTYVGSWAGFRNATGSSNTFLGQQAGFNALGNGNVMLGYSAGYSETGSNKLYIDNSSTTVPLIYGDFSSNKVGINTNQLPNSVGGANTSAYSLYVKGGILTEELRVRTGWADYVFESDYQLPSLTEVEQFISQHGHLPNIPSAEQVAAQGIELGDMARLQQEKIEELTLYVIQQQKELAKQQEEMEALKVLVNQLIEQK